MVLDTRPEMWLHKHHIRYKLHFHRYTFSVLLVFCTSYRKELAMHNIQINMLKSFLTGERRGRKSLGIHP